MPTKKILNTIIRHKLIRKNDTVLIGVSGGPDSVCLLYLLRGLRKQLGIKLYIAHLDHMLRKDSAKDAAFVTRLAQRLNIPFSIGKINVKQKANNASLEETARNARLDFLFSVARKIGADKIALAHNLDDQAETVLMRIMRGSGLYGLAAIIPKRSIAGFVIIRPLLEVRRKEIERFLRKRHIAARKDASNKEDIFFRNKIRNRLIPLLEKEYSSNIKELLANMADTIGNDYDCLTRVAQKAGRGIKKALPLKKLMRYHPAIQRLLIRRAIAQVQGDTRRITLQHIREIEDLMCNRPANSVVDLPKGVWAVKKRNSIFFYRKRHR